MSVLDKVRDPSRQPQYNADVLSYMSQEGFFSLYEECLSEVRQRTGEQPQTDLAAYELAELIYSSYYGANKYGSYSSFKMCYNRVFKQLRKVAI